MPSNATYAGRVTRQLPSHPPGRSPLTRANDRSLIAFRLDARLEPQPFLSSFPPRQPSPVVRAGKIGRTSSRDLTKEWGQHTTRMVSHAAPVLVCLLVSHATGRLSQLVRGKVLGYSSSRGGFAGKMGGLDLDAPGRNGSGLTSLIP